MFCNKQLARHKYMQHFFPFISFGTGCHSLASFDMLSSYLLNLMHFVLQALECDFLFTLSLY